MKYKLTLTDEQAQTVATACEFYARIMMGQFTEITWHTMMCQPMDDTWCDRRDAAETYLYKARQFIYPELGGRGSSYGIGKFEDADEAFDVYQALRQKFPHDGRLPFSYKKIPECEVEDD